MPNPSEPGSGPTTGPDPAPSEAPTTVIPHVTRAAPTRVGGPAPAMPEPQAAPDRRRRWPLILGGVVAAGALGAGGVLLVDRVAGGGAESDVRAAITGFVDALDRGDLAVLRSGSCGDLGDYYRQVSDADFADVYRSASTERAVPVIESIDAVSVTDTTALAQVTVRTAGDPASSSVRSFALEQQDGVWKVCS